MRHTSLASLLFRGALVRKLPPHKVQQRDLGQSVTDLLTSRRPEDSPKGLARHLGLLLIRPRQAEISEDVAGTRNYVKFVFGSCPVALEGSPEPCAYAVSVSCFGIENFEVALRGSLCESLI